MTTGQQCLENPPKGQLNIAIEYANESKAEKKFSRHIEVVIVMVVLLLNKGVEHK